MSQPDSTSGSDLATGGQGDESSGLVDAGTVAEYARRGLQSSLVTGIVGGALLLSGLRSLRKGRWGRGLLSLLAGAGFTALAVVQRESGGSLGGADVEPTDVVDTAPDIDDVADEAGAANGHHASGDEATEVVDTAPDVEDAGPSPEVEAEGDAVDQTDVVDAGADAAEDLEDASETDD